MTILADIRYSLRGVRRSPAYAAVAALTLAVGIGATTGVVSIVDAVVFRALPYRDAASLGAMFERTDKGNGRTPSYPAYKDYVGAVGGPIAGIAFGHGGPVPYRTANGLERLIAYRVTPGFFPLMGTHPLLGREFMPAEERSGGAAVAVLSYGLWRQEFGGDRAVVGRTIDLDSVPTTIVGVMPQEFDYPEGTQLWMPIAPVESRWEPLLSREVHADSRTIVRLRSPRDSAAAAAALGVVAARLAKEYPESSAHWTGADFWPMRTQVIGDIGGTLYTLAGAATLVLLLACANVATLALIRGSVRSRELAVRVALGATRARIARQLVAEVAVIAFAGAAAGMAFAAVIVRTVRHLMGAQLPRSSELVVDGRMYAIGIAVALVATMVVSLAPVMRSTRTAVAQRLHGWSHGSGIAPRDSVVRSGLVAVQVALAVTLLLGAGLLLQSFRRLYAIPDDYDSAHIATAAIFPPSPAYDRPADAAALYDRLKTAVARVPGVDAVAIVNHIGGRLPTRVEIPGRPSDGSTRSTAYYVTASDEYQRAMGFRMIRGRWLNGADMRAPEASGFVINEAMAARFFPGENPLGRVITVHRTSQARPDIGQPISGPIVGVMADVHFHGQENRVEPEVYVSYTREVWPWVTLVAHAAKPAEVAPGILKAILGVDPNIPLSAGNTFSGVETPRPRGGFDRRELTLTMVGAFAAVALLLAAIGLYGVVAYGITQRTRELGIRMALGATRGNVAWLVLSGVGKLVAAGIAAGLAGGFAATRLIRSLLFHTAPTDPMTFVAVPVVLAIVALGAAWLPARRAMRLEPTITLKAD
ncbi:MAG: ADOP family duplicated permease [Gemmatimonadales bacterium]